MAQPFRKHALSAGEASRSSPSISPERGGGALEEPLWIAVCLSTLALRAAEGGETSLERLSEQPSVVVESARGRLCVVAADAAARALGIVPGLHLNAAFAFSGSLRVLERSPGAERVHLEALAAACRKLTPMVSLELPESLLLEVRGSLKLFGGFENIRKILSEELERRGFAFQSAAAPTPLGALWLARHRGGDALSTAALLSRCNAVPLEVTRWPESTRAALKDMGVTTIGDCLRLPRGGFARRMGKRCLEDLDRALGRQPDPRLRYEPPQSLRYEVELLDGSTSLPVFIDAAARMTKQLADELRVRQAQIRELRLVFRHRGQAPTVCLIGLLEASGDERRLTELCSDKLERLVLPAPATSLSLFTGPLLPAKLDAGRLFRGVSSGNSGDDEAAIRLVERLRGRLGSRAVHGLALAAEHRPEKAWIDVEAEPRRSESSAPVSPSAHDRPLWLLREPQPLSCVGSSPCLDGVLRLRAGPERIESGWWDGRDVSRDYFAATTQRGEKLWVYRDRVDSRWYLHGYFG